MADDPLQRRKSPCEECPWRRDTPPGQFPAERYEALRTTRGARGEEAGVYAPLFACHKSAEGKEIACAGWLAVCGYDHLGIRIALMDGRIPPEAMEPGEDWPELFETYDEMAEAQGGTCERDNETEEEYGSR